MLLPGAVTVARPCVTSVPLPGGLSAKRGVGGSGGRGAAGAAASTHVGEPRSMVGRGCPVSARPALQASGGTRVPRAVLPGPRPCPGGFSSEPRVGLDFRAPAGRRPLGLADCDPREAKCRPSATSKLNEPVSTRAVPPRRSAVSAPGGAAGACSHREQRARPPRLRWTCLPPPPAQWARVRVRDGLPGALPEPVTSGEGLGRARAETSVAEAAGLGR